MSSNQRFGASALYLYIVSIYFLQIDRLAINCAGTDMIFALFNEILLLLFFIGTTR